jgi:hypothetical protein
MIPLSGKSLDFYHNIDSVRFNFSLNLLSTSDELFGKKKTCQFAKHSLKTSIRCVCHRRRFLNGPTCQPIVADPPFVKVSRFKSSHKGVELSGQ